MFKLYIVLVVVVCDACSSCFSVFFFKQKTAYEMRISDWSSDVCSSDLIGDVLDHALDDLALGQRLDEAAALFGAGFFQDGAARHDDVAAAAIHLQDLEGQIGSASCRERVCQYV